MLKWLKIAGVALISLEFVFLSSAEDVTRSTNLISIQSVSVNGNPIRYRQNNSVDLGPSPKNILFGFGPNNIVKKWPARLRYQLQGYETEWHDCFGKMGLTIRFYDNSGDIIDEKTFWVDGESAGWNKSLVTSLLIHRQETFVVPERASKVMVVISSAGPPETTGIYVVANLVVSESSNNSKSTVLIQSPFDRQADDNRDDITNQTPDGWIRDGIHPSMARIVEIGQRPSEEAFAILDDDPIGHAEWHNILDVAPRVSPGDHLVVEWNEMYSIGSGSSSVASYYKLASGKYAFVVEGTDLLGNPTGVRTSLAVLVQEPIWKMLWFWCVVFVVGVGISFGTNRYFLWHRLQREMARLRDQRSLEEERMRIARDIHDDLGARVSQISLVSAMACDDPKIQEESRADFVEISRMSRDLISALYETVWAVNPENDNMEALGNYLVQMINGLSAKAQFLCRFYVQRLPRDIEVSSQLRHSIIMAAKEAVHNVIKHARASLLIVRITFAKKVLTVSIQDDGCGFQPNNHESGNGLGNMRQRLENLGGNCSIESQPGGGTTVVMQLEVRKRT